MQECVVKLVDKINVLRRHSESKRRNYIITTAKNTSISHLRSMASQRGTSYEDWMKDCVGTDQEDNPEELILHQEEIQRLRMIWERLDERSRYALSGRYILEQSFDEMAKKLGVSAASVRMMVTRAKRAAIALLQSSDVSVK